MEYFNYKRVFLFDFVAQLLIVALFNHKEYVSLIVAHKSNVAQLSHNTLTLMM